MCTTHRCLKPVKQRTRFRCHQIVPVEKFEHEFILVIVHGDTMNDNDRSTYLSWYHHEVR